MVLPESEAYITTKRPWQVGNFEFVPISSNKQIVTPDGRRLIKKGILAEKDRETTIANFEDEKLKTAKNQPVKDVLKQTARMLTFTAFVSTGAFGIKVGIPAIENLQDWQSSETLPNDQSLVFGGSFSIESYGISLESMDTLSGKIKYQKAMDDLKTIVETEKVKNLRVCLQMKNTIDNNGNFTSKFIEPELKYLFNQENMKLTINIGIKTFGFPEQNVKKNIETDLKQIINRDGIVKAEDFSGRQALQNETDILHYLQSNFTKEQLANVSTIQFNNESNKKFGLFAVKISNELNIAMTDNLMNNFPQFSNKTFLYNIGSSDEIPETIDLFKKLKNRYPDISLRLGINYYPFDTGDTKIPLLGKVDSQNLPVLGHVDQIFYDKIDKNLFQYAKETQSKIGFDIEITELQAEPWKGKHLPGNKLNNFNYAAKRALTLFPEKMNLKNENIWGWKYLLENKNDPQIKKILNEIAQQNDLN
jgi:hypothetical protein